jgi:hypothetical protein
MLTTFCRFSKIGRRSWPAGTAAYTELAARAHRADRPAARPRWVWRLDQRMMNMQLSAPAVRLDALRHVGLEAQVVRSRNTKRCQYASVQCSADCWPCGSSSRCQRAVIVGSQRGIPNAKIGGNRGSGDTAQLGAGGYSGVITCSKPVPVLSRASHHIPVEPERLFVRETGLQSLPAGHADVMPPTLS